VWKANDVVIDALQASAICCNWKVQHSYLHCWRYKTPIIFRPRRSGSSMENISWRICGC
jgi:isoleucyl-tRNA synthetase